MHPIRKFFKAFPLSPKATSVWLCPFPPVPEGKGSSPKLAVTGIGKALFSARQRRALSPLALPKGPQVCGRGGRGAEPHACGFGGKGNHPLIPLRARTSGGRLSAAVSAAAATARLSEAAFAAQTGPPFPPGGLATFVKMQTDAQVRACLTTKRLSVLSERILVSPEGDSSLAREAAQFVEASVRATPGGWAAICAGALDALAMGFALGEMLHTENGAFNGVRWHDPRRFAFHADPWGEIAEIELTETGEKWPDACFVRYVHQGRWGSPFGESDLVAAYRPWAQKDALRRMWLSALDRFGAPTPIARVPLSWSQDECDRLAHQLGRLQNEAALVLPDDVELSVALDQSRASGEPGAGFAHAVDFENREIARAILGQELTTQAGGAGGGGSYALGRVHESVLENAVRAVRADLSERLLTGQIATRLVRARFGEGVPVPRVHFADLSEAELAARRQLVTDLLAGHIIAPDEAWIRAYLGVPQAQTHTEVAP